MSTSIGFKTPVCWHNQADSAKIPYITNVTIKDFISVSYKYFSYHFIYTIIIFLISQVG